MARDYRCNNSNVVIPEGNVFFQITLGVKGQQPSQEQQGRLNIAQQLLYELDFATPKDMAQYIINHPELHNL